MDRGFYDVQIKKIVDKLHVKFIIFSKVYKNLKKFLNSIGEIDIAMSRVVGTKYTDFVEVNFVSHYNKSKKMRFGYITNMDITPKEAYTLYGNTTSKSYVVRITYLMISISIRLLVEGSLLRCLYNLWVLINLIVEGNIIKRFERINKKYKPSITTRKVKKACSRLLLNDMECVI